MLNCHFNKSSGFFPLLTRQLWARKQLAFWHRQMSWTIAVPQFPFFSVFHSWKPKLWAGNGKGETISKHSKSSVYSNSPLKGKEVSIFEQPGWPQEAEGREKVIKTQIENVQQQCLVNTSVQSTLMTAKTDRRKDAFDSQRAQVILLESDGSNKLVTTRYTWQPNIHLYWVPSGRDDSGFYAFDTALICRV